MRRSTQSRTDFTSVIKLFDRLHANTSWRTLIVDSESQMRSVVLMFKPTSVRRANSLHKSRMKMPPAPASAAALDSAAIEEREIPPAVVMPPICFRVNQSITLEPTVYRQPVILSGIHEASTQTRKVKSVCPPKTSEESMRPWRYIRTRYAARRCIRAGLSVKRPNMLVMKPISGTEAVNSQMKEPTRVIYTDLSGCIAIHSELFSVGQSVREKCIASGPAGIE